MDPCQNTVLRRETLNISVQRKDLPAEISEHRRKEIIHLTGSTTLTTDQLHLSHQDHPTAREYYCKNAQNP